MRAAGQAGTQTTTAAKRHGALNVYMKELHAIPSLSREQEKEIVARWKNGDERARDELVRASLSHVVYVARRYAASGERLEDLIAEGNLALLHALRKYDPSFGTRFGSYARLWVRAYLTRYVRRGRSLVSTPLHDQAALLASVRGLRQRFASLANTEDIDDIIANRLGVTVDDIRNAEMRFSQRDMSFDVATSDEQRPLHDIVPSKGPSPFDVALVRQLEGVVEETIDSADISDREREILRRRLLCAPGDEPSFAQLGREMQLSREWVRRLEHRALKRVDASFEELRARRDH